MILQRAWLPVASAEPLKDEQRQPIDTKDGQSYAVETGADAFFLRGAIVALEKDEDPSSLFTNDDDDNAVFDRAINPNQQERSLRDLVLCASLCNQATLHRENAAWKANGDPTEIALQVFAHKLGMGKVCLEPIRSRLTSQPHLTHPPKPAYRLPSRNDPQALQRTLSGVSDMSGGRTQPALLRGHWQMLKEHPFDSSIKRMSTAWRFIPAEGSSSKERVLLFLKGAVERVLERCTHVGLDGKEELTDARREDILNRMESFAADGLRVLALAGRWESVDKADELESMSRDDFEQGNCLIGLVGIYDPPRPESKGAVAECLRAGIVPRMLTGDHKATATSIAKAVGILKNTHGKSAVMTGQEFDALSEEQIDQLEELPVVVARCSPQTKVRMVEALHRRGQTTAMTGDGTNDAPALKRADVGVAMGELGSDTAKQAADVILADDNFSTIVRAIRKGRSVFRNLSKFLLYLLSGNVAEVLVLLIGLAFRELPGSNGARLSVFPLSPVAALWINTIA